MAQWTKTAWRSKCEYFLVSKRSWFLVRSSLNLTLTVCSKHIGFIHLIVFVILWLTYSWKKNSLQWLLLTLYLAFVVIKLTHTVQIRINLVWLTRMEPLSFPPFINLVYSQCKFIHIFSGSNNWLNRLINIAFMFPKQTKSSSYLNSKSFVSLLG